VIARLEEICSLITDGSHFSPEDEGAGYPMFSVKDMTPNGFNISGCKKIGEEAYKKLVANGCKPLNDDVVVAKDGSYLKTAFVIKGNPEIALLSSIAILRPKIDLVVPEYLSYFLKSDAVYRTVSLNYITGTALKRIILKGIRKIEVDLPDIGEQEQRAQRLSKVDYLCQLRKQQLDKLDELVKARFVEMFGDPVRNEKGWNTYALAEMCDGIGDGLHGTPEYDENGEYPFINGNNLIDGVIQINESTKKVNKKTYEKHYIKISQNAILLSINGTLGKIAFYNGEQVMLGKSACYCNLKDEVNRIFVYKIMKTDAFAGYLEDNSTKSTIKNVGLKAIREYRLIAPPLSLQNQFAVFAEYVDQQKQTVQQSLEKLELMKKALMQEYFG